MIKNEKDGIIIDMKVKGCSNKEISQATNTPVKTIGNLVSKGGRLYPALQSLRQTKEAVLVENNLTVWDSLLASKEPAISELKRIALESPNDVPRLKAIDMILELTGIRDEDRPPLLDPNNLNGSLHKFLRWINAKLVKTFGENAPKVNFGNNEDSQEGQMTPEDMARMERIIADVEIMKEANTSIYCDWPNWTIDDNGTFMSKYGQTGIVVLDEERKRWEIAKEYYQRHPSNPGEWK